MATPTTQPAARKITPAADFAARSPALLLTPRGRRFARSLLVVGRFVAVLLPVAGIHAIYAPTAGSVFVTSTGFATAIWFTALRRAYSATRPSRYALGVPLTSALGTLVGLAAMTAVSFLLPVLKFGHREVLLMSAAVLLASAAFETIVRLRPAFRRRVLVVGVRAGGAKLVDDLRHARSPFTCTGVVDQEVESERVAGSPVLGRVDALPEIVDRVRPELVVLAGVNPRAVVVDRLLDSPWSGFRILDVSQFYEHAFGRVPVERLSPTWFMSILHLYQRPASRLSKRLFDVTFAGAGLVLAGPLLLLLGWLVHRSGPGPILLRQVRLGKGGKPFEMLKFRTMRDGAESPGAARWAEVDDPRVTPVGRVMRRARLDELPQLWNVLRGQMSVIGPRPERPEFLEFLQHEIPFWTRRHLVKPGITGWAQVNGGYASDSRGMAMKLSHDLYYLKHRSLLLDLAILVKTAKIAFSGSGAR